MFEKYRLIKRTCKNCLVDFWVSLGQDNPSSYCDRCGGLLTAETMRWRFFYKAQKAKVVEGRSLNEALQQINIAGFADQEIVTAHPWKCINDKGERFAYEAGRWVQEP